MNLPYTMSPEMVADAAKAFKPKILYPYHYGRTDTSKIVELLKGVGVTELVLPFFEGSLEMIRHTLHRFGMTSTEIQYILNNLREGRSEEKEQ